MVCLSVLYNDLISYKKSCIIFPNNIIVLTSLDLNKLLVGSYPVVNRKQTKRILNNYKLKFKYLSFNIFLLKINNLTTLFLSLPFTFIFLVRPCCGSFSYSAARLLLRTKINKKLRYLVYKNKNTKTQGILYI